MNDSYYGMNSKGSKLEAKDLAAVDQDNTISFSNLDLEQLDAALTLKLKKPESLNFNKSEGNQASESMMSI